MGKGLFQRAVKSFSNATSDMLGQTIEEERKKRLARYETDLNLELDDNRHSNSLALTTHQSSERVRSAGEIATAEDTRMKDRFEDITVTGPDGKEITVAQRDTNSGQRTELNSHDSRSALQDDSQDFQKGLLTTKLDFEGQQKAYDRFWQTYVQHRAQKFQGDQAAMDRTMKYDITNKTLGAGLFETLAKSSSQQLTDLQAEMSMVPEGDPRREALKAKYNAAYDNWESMFDRVVTDFKLEDVPAFSSLGKTPGMGAPASDTAIDSPSGEGNAGHAGGSATLDTAAPAVAESTVPPPASTLDSASPGLLSQAAGQVMSAEDQSFVDKQMSTIRALKKNLPRAIGGSRKLDIERRLNSSMAEVEAMYEKYGLTVGQKFFEGT